MVPRLTLRPLEMLFELASLRWVHPLVPLKSPSVPPRRALVGAIALMPLTSMALGPPLPGLPALLAHPVGLPGCQAGLRQRGCRPPRNLAAQLLGWGCIGASVVVEGVGPRPKAGVPGVPGG